MVARRISPNRPRLLAAVMAARDHELERGDSLRPDLLEFATFCLMVELTGGRLHHQPVLDPFLIMLGGMSKKYQTPVICRALAALAEDGVHP